jgi:hypothetical protein
VRVKVREAKLNLSEVKPNLSEVRLNLSEVRLISSTTLSIKTFSKSKNKMLPFVSKFDP